MPKKNVIPGAENVIAYNRKISKNYKNWVTEQKSYKSSVGVQTNNKQTRKKMAQLFLDYSYTKFAEEDWTQLIMDRQHQKVPYRYLCFEKCYLNDTTFKRLTQLLLHPDKTYLFQGCVLDLSGNHISAASSAELWAWAEWVACIQLKCTRVSCKQIQTLLRLWQHQPDFEARRAKLIFMDAIYLDRPPPVHIYAPLEHDHLLSSLWVLEQQHLYQQTAAATRAFHLYQRHQSLLALRRRLADVPQRSTLKTLQKDDCDDEDDQLTLEQVCRMME